MVLEFEENLLDSAPRLCAECFLVDSEEDSVFLLDFFQVADSRCEGIRLNVIMLPPRFPALGQAKIVPGSALRVEIFRKDQI